MLDGLFLLLTMSVVMALASFFAGALPLSMNLSSWQLRLLSSLGMGILVGTSLIVIIPEGIDSIYTAEYVKREVQVRSPFLTLRAPETQRVNFGSYNLAEAKLSLFGREENELDNKYTAIFAARQDGEGKPQFLPVDNKQSGSPSLETAPSRAYNGTQHRPESQTFSIGLSLILGFLLMFLIDKLPQHASDNLQSTPTRHISLSNLSLSSPTSDETSGSDSFLQSLTPTTKQTRSLATTTGLVIHAAADGIAMGASISSSNMKLGFIIFFAIIVHKAPAAFGLTSVLLKHGLSKRAIRGHLIIFSLATPLGALKTWLLIAILGGSHVDEEGGSWWTGMLLLFSAGTFLYVAMHAVHAESTFDYSPITNGFIETGFNSSQRKASKPQMRDTLAAVCGMLLPLLLQLGLLH